VRAAVVAQLRRALRGRNVHAVLGASMERRAGPEYDFNEPMLESVLGTPTLRAAPKGGAVVLAMLFLQPGKHAGSGGDVDEIVAQALAEAEAEAGPGTYGGGPILKTELLAPHPQLLELLAQRATQPALITS
jgi:hypothetical protein